jgi:hypothetical protein
VDPLSQEGEFIQGSSVACYIMCIAESSDPVSGSQHKTTTLAVVVSSHHVGGVTVPRQLYVGCLTMLSQ